MTKWQIVLVGSSCFRKIMVIDKKSKNIEDVIKDVKFKSIDDIP